MREVEASHTPKKGLTYKTTEQFLEVFKSLDDEKLKELESAGIVAATFVVPNPDLQAAWTVGRNASLGVLTKGEITTEQFEILTIPWTNCGLSLFIDDDVANKTLDSLFYQNVETLNADKAPLTTPQKKLTYKTTEQFVKLFDSLDDEKIKELSVAYETVLRLEATNNENWTEDYDSAFSEAEGVAMDADLYDDWDDAWQADSDETPNETWGGAEAASLEAIQSANLQITWIEDWDTVFRKAWDAGLGSAWDAARHADAAVLAKDTITTKQFEILTKPWTNCGLSLFFEGDEG